MSKTIIPHKFAAEVQANLKAKTRAAGRAASETPWERFLTRKELAERWDVSVGRLANDASAGRGCAFLRLGRGGTVRYPLSLIIEFEQKSLVSTLDQRVSA